MLPFSPDVKWFQHIFFSFQSFSARISCDPNPDSWSLNRRNEIVCIAHLLLIKIMIYSFLSFPVLPRSGSAFYFMNSDPEWAKTCGYFSQIYPCILLPFPFLSFSYITNRNLNSLPFPSFPSPSHPFSLYFLHFSFANSPIDFFPRQLDIIGKKIKRSLPFSLFPFSLQSLFPFLFPSPYFFSHWIFFPANLMWLGRKLAFPIPFLLTFSSLLSLPFSLLLLIFSLYYFPFFFSLLLSSYYSTLYAPETWCV